MKDVNYIYFQFNKLNNLKLKKVDIGSLINSESLDFNLLQNQISKSEEKKKIRRKLIFLKKGNHKTENKSINILDYDKYYSTPSYNHIQLFI